MIMAMFGLHTLLASPDKDLDLYRETGKQRNFIWKLVFAPAEHLRPDLTNERTNEQ